MKTFKVFLDGGYELFVTPHKDTTSEELLTLSLRSNVTTLQNINGDYYAINPAKIVMITEVKNDN